MGAQFSASKDTTCLGIAVGKEIYRPGEEVRGVVMLNVASTIAAKDMLLKVVGKEATHLDKTEAGWDKAQLAPQFRASSAGAASDGPPPTAAAPQFGAATSERELQLYEGTHVLIDVTVPLFTATRQLDAGRYEFPFTFVLPPDIPGTFHYSGQDVSEQQGLIKKKGRDNQACIGYKVEAEVMTTNKRRNHLMAAVPLVVQQVEQAQHAGMVQPDKPAKVSEPMNKGRVVVSARTERTVYHAGDKLAVLLEVENTSKCAFKEVCVELKRVVRIRTGKGMAYTATASSIAIGQVPVLAGRDSFQQLLVLQMPKEGLMPTTRTKLVTCTNYVALKLRTEGLLHKSVRLEVPVKYYSTPVHPKGCEPAVPPEWWTATAKAELLAIKLPGATSPAGPVLLPPAPLQQARMAPHTGGSPALWYNPSHGTFPAAISL